MRLGEPSKKSSLTVLNFMTFVLALGLVTPTYAKSKIFEVIENGLLGILKGQLRYLENTTDIVSKQLDVEKEIEKLTKEMKVEISRKMSGCYDMGSLLNGRQEQEERRWNPSDPFTIQSNKVYKFLRDTHLAKYNFEEDFGVKNEFHKAALQDYNEAQTTAIVSAQYSIKKIEASISQIETLLSQIDKTENLKASMDLNSRIQSQVALELIELKRLASFQLQALGMTIQQPILEQQGNVQFNRWT